MKYYAVETLEEACDVFNSTHSEEIIVLHKDGSYCKVTSIAEAAELLKSTVSCKNPLHDLQIKQDGRCHWCEEKEKLQKNIIASLCRMKDVI